MSINARLELNDSASKAPKNAGLPALSMNEQFNDVFLKATNRPGNTSFLPSAEELLKGLTQAPDGVAKAIEGGVAVEKKVQQGVLGIAGEIASILGGPNEQAWAKAQKEMDKQQEKWIHDEEKKQHRIAEREAKDPHSQKVTEKHNGPVETVTVERNDGSIVTYFPGGAKMTEKEGVKTTEYPKGNIFGLRSSVEYANGATETTFENGSVVYKPAHGNTVKIDHDGTRTEYKPDNSQVITRPDHTQIVIKDGRKTTHKPDGTEIVEEPNGDRVVTKPESVRPDGTKIWHKEDGTEIREKPDGTRVTEFPEQINETVKAIAHKPNGDVVILNRDYTAVVFKKDGTIITEGNDGTAQAIHSNGSLEFKRDDGTRELIEPDGSKFTKHPDSSVELKFADGSSLTRDAKGHMEQQLAQRPSFGLFNIFQPQTAETVDAALKFAIREAIGFSITW